MAKDWTDCPECGVSVKKKNLQRHIRGIHGGRKVPQPKETAGPSRRGLVYPVLIVVFLVAAGALGYVVLSPPSQTGGGSVNPNETQTVAVVTTSMGTFEVLLYTEKAPITTDNFIKLANDKFYDGLIFHRVIDGFMIQGGGFEPGMAPKSSPYGTIPLETGAGLGNARGTLAMARTSNPDSATSQFFVNLVDNPSLDPGANQPGYAVFGRVTSGMDVVDAIGKVATHSTGGYDDVPTVDVVILSVRIETR